MDARIKATGGGVVRDGSQPAGSARHLFVRQSSGLVREASAIDATIFNAVLSAPVGATLAWFVFFALTAFPGSDLVFASIASIVINAPIIIMFALLTASMPRTGGDYVWVSRILAPPLAVVSNFAAGVAGMVGVVFWARFFPVFALGPTLVALGIFFNNNTLVNWGNHVQSDGGWILLAGFAMMALLVAVMIAGTKTTFRWQNAFWTVASIGTFLAFVVLLFGSSTAFQHNFNALSARFGAHGDAYHAVVAAVRKQIATAPNAGNLSSTLPSLFVIMSFMMWNWWSCYIGGELKSASNRRRQLSIMFGALIWDAGFIAIGVLLLYKVAGYAFISSINVSPNPAYKIPTGAWYHFLASITANIPIVTVLIVGSFLFWSLPAMITNMYMPVRTVFAWAFDRLLPDKLAEVNDRTHSPVPAIVLMTVIISLILIWSVVATTFQTVVALGVLAGVITVCIVSVAAFTFPDRQPALYESSPANVRVAGIPLLKIVAPISFLVMAFLVYDVLAYPALAIGSAQNWWQVPVYMAGVAAIALVIFYTARYLRRRQGIDVDLIYRELPPE